MKILAAFAPSQDKKDRFFSTTPTSLGWVLAPLIAEIDAGNLPGVEYCKKIYDPLRVNIQTQTEFELLLEREKPDVLLLSSTYDSHYSAIRLGKMMKHFNSDALVVYGGPHVDEVASSGVIALMPQIYPFNEVLCPFDILVKGDGDRVLVQLVKDLIKNKGVENLLEYLGTQEASLSFACVPGIFEVHTMTKKNGIKVIKGGVTPLDISQLPFIPRKLFGNDLDLLGFSCFREQKSDGTFALLPSTSTMLHRGCRNFCIFCSERGGYSARRLSHIATELDELVRAGYKGVFFDDSTLGDHEGLDDLLSCLGDFPLQYGSLNRFDMLNDARLVEKLAKSGFVYQYCAIEQFDSAVLKQNAKGQGLDTIRRGVANLAANGIQLGTSLLFGLCGETEDGINATLDFVAALDKFGVLSCVSMSLYSYHPNTPLTLGTKEGRKMQQVLRFDQEPPNRGEPWDLFEEGQWFHPHWLTSERVDYIQQLAQTKVGSKLVRNMNKSGDRT